MKFYKWERFFSFYTSIYKRKKNVVKFSLESILLLLLKLNIKIVIKDFAVI